jgi:hypothetical protein
MKKFLSLFLLFSCYNAFSQIELSQLFTIPPSGMELLGNQNPYILAQQMNGSTWQDYRLYRNSKASNIDSIGFNIVSDWQNNNIWKDLQINRDSFILNNQGNVGIHISDDEYFFSTTSYRMKRRYTYSYASPGKPVAAKLEYADEPDYTSYYDVAEVLFNYDQNGRRIHDSVYYYDNGIRMHEYFIYDNLGRLSAQFSLEGQDTIAKTYLTYNYISHSVATATTTSLNQHNEWIISAADTMLYDAQGRVQRHIQWGLVLDQSAPELHTGLISDESYHYTSANKPDEIIYTASFGEKYKITIEYNNQNKPVIGYRYDLNPGSGWSTEPSMRYLFEVPTGLNDQLINGDKHNVSVYPNPATDLITISIEDASDKIKEIKMFDLNGKRMSPVENADHTIDVASLCNGMYGLIVITENGLSVQKISVQH